MSEQENYEPEPLGPMTEQDADDYLKERNLLEHEIATLKAQLEEKLSHPRGLLFGLTSRHEHRLEQYVRAEAERTGRRTFPLWHGTCRLTKTGGRPVIEDEHAAVDYAEANGYERFLNPMSIRKGEYQKFAAEVLKKQGELLPGCELESERDSFSVSFKTKETDGLPDDGLPDEESGL